MNPNSQNPYSCAALLGIDQTYSKKIRLLNFDQKLKSIGI
jgi:hypothetical protein